MLHLLKKIKNTYTAHRTNRGGMRLKERLVILESDDWGAIRTPSATALEAFVGRGFAMAGSVYQYDMLESAEDLDRLFNLLLEFRDNRGNPPVITGNMIMANPDFEAIRQSGFSAYQYELSSATCLRHAGHELVPQLWNAGMQQHVFRPQFHGREHLQYKRWLRTLQTGDASALFAFDRGATYSGKADYSFMEAFDWDAPEDIAEQKNVLTEGLRLFEQQFGFRSRTFIAPCYNWDPAIEPHLKSQGIDMLQGIRSQLCPTGTFDQYRKIAHHFGETNKAGMRFSIRNCFLEPSLYPGRDWVDLCLMQIRTAFMYRKPAVICTHRINYVGGILAANRDRGLRDLKRLLSAISVQWPDAQFISSDQLTDYL
jgi:hypothetical protein